ncbi:hypothetical protein A3B02_01895 [Candidatus Roizmanbacteria bacterium RIFCSPLOWO2_01_FULL_42_14]|uniref:Glycosyltransferase 2-like domain-containing protein n=4 Tax=Candidatus Roizmaniibacteriota TaxID=1752723 RepID=A0A1F7JUU9_9BACT|nr:MAG: hypothetical protein A3D08_02420 [Candidatus Roizmanbacteria bacterium RIFCSPHIGHO2_02_FULL_43_11]OGK38381.1 MAG: hypothetical protein A3F32_00165 [Candidatus Roizmanbacteria bacterium RIFCSPHIGHO2_12_FULL_42_10]OGK52472.1 MAG: hypothetical protein A3B02_01895 [Candidatus Roizmanbacteria bacterium RIFCSPLOWO2_01_FULL_42_14]OGK59403.1 MAG: hypothetical protein A3I56_01875 [Candidatus Roizmanbacteria bacterium RIFCSPLOWO2_02_FULL_43_10]
MTKKKAVVILPAYNEREGLKELIPQIFTATQDLDRWDVQILVVDANSPDGTINEINTLQKKHPGKLHLLVETKKEGLGRAYVKGFKHAIAEHNPYVMFEMDADGQHTASLIPAFLEKIEAGADFVIGSRYIKGGSVPDNWGIDRKMFSRVGSLVAQVGFMNFKAKDWTSGYRCIKTFFLKDVVDHMHHYNGYEFQIALLDKAFKKHLKIDEVPLVFTDRKDGVSKFNSIAFITKALMYILTQSSFVRFSFVGLSGAVVDFGFAALFIYLFNIFKPTANAMSAEIAIIFNFLMNNFWSFKHKKIKNSFLKKFLHFNVVASGSIAIQWVGMKLALDAFGDQVVPLPFIGIHSWMIYKVFIIAVLVIPYSYITYNKIIWKTPRKS